SRWRRWSHRIPKCVLETDATGLLALGTGYHEQPDGASERDRGAADSVAEGKPSVGHVCQRLPVLGKGHARVGALVEGAWLAAKAGRDRESGAVAGSPRAGSSASR